MAQDLFSSINPTSTSGTQLATLLVAFKEALVSNLSGDTRPPELDPGGGWIDTSMEDTPNFYWTYKIWTGSIEVEVFRVNLQTGTTSISGADSDFTLTKISADNVGALLKLKKERIANSGQVLDTDVIGEIQFIGAASDNSNPVVARIRALATDNMTATASGGMIVIEGTLDAATGVSEFMRLLDGKMGMGTTAPDSTIHVVGTTGIKSERSSDDATGALISIRKRRTTGGALQSGDSIGQLRFNSTDNGPTEVNTAQIEASTAEAHTTTAQGTVLKLKIAKTGTALLSTVMQLGNKIESYVAHILNAFELASQSVATAASITQLSATKAVVYFTGSTATTLHGINSGQDTKVIVLHNASTATITLANESATATAADRAVLPGGNAIDIDPGGSLELFYSTVESRWKIKSGSGSGGGALRVTATQTLAAAGSITTTTADSRQLRYVQGTGGATTISTTPFGTTGGWKDGTEVHLVGVSDDNTVILTNTDSAKGVVGNFSTIEIGRFTVVKMVYSTTLDRWIVTNY